MVETRRHCGEGPARRHTNFYISARQWGLSIVLMSFTIVWAFGTVVADAGWPSERGPDDFRISSMGPNGNVDYGAFWFLVPNMTPDAAYNPVTDEYLVVWYADDNTAPLVDEEHEIFGQRVKAATGALVGDRFRISFMGPNGNPEYDALLPAVTYNSFENEFMVVWVGDHHDPPLVNDHFEVFGRRVSAAGQLLGSQARLSEMGPSSDPAYGVPWWVGPDIAYNALDGIYMVVWCADSDVPPQVNDEFEIWGRRYDPNLTPIDGLWYTISVMGQAGDPAYYATRPAVAWDSNHNNFLVVWEGDHTDFGLVDNEFEIFGQLVPADPTVHFFVYDNFQISLMGGANGDSVYDAFDPDVAYNPIYDNFFVTWWGDDNQWPTADEEFEVWGRLVAWDGTLLNTQYRLSAMGFNDGDTTFAAYNPAVISGEHDYHVVWHADDDAFAVVDDEFEVFTNLVPANPGVFGLVVENRLTTMGSNGDPTRGAFGPALAYDHVRDAGLLVWWGDDNVSPSVDDEFEVFGQLLGFSFIFADGFESGDTSRWSTGTP